MNAHLRTTRTGMLAAALGAAGLVTVLASAPAQAVDYCRLTVLSVTGYELQDGNGTDEIKYDLGDDRYGPYTFWDNWTRNASLGYKHEDFVSWVDVGLFEMDGLVRQTIDVDRVYACDEGEHTLDLVGNGAIYEMRYELDD